ncbi:hypothetical protein ACHAXS_012549 [Conticribra weissflogii]
MMRCARFLVVVLLLLLLLSPVAIRGSSPDECAADDDKQEAQQEAQQQTLEQQQAQELAQQPQEHEQQQLQQQREQDALFQESVLAWNGTVIDHVPFADMTFRRFVRDYQSKRKPVVLTGTYAASPLTEGVDDARWGWRALRDRFGDVVLETLVTGGHRDGGCSGTGLCEGPPVRLGDLLDRHFSSGPSDADHDDDAADAAPYPHDIELKAVLPDLFRAYRKPALFAENLLLPLKAGRDRWPSVFFGAPGTQTNLHVDSMGTSFTMAVFRGRKQFLLFDPRDAPALCVERPTPPLDYGVGVDPFRPAFDLCPDARTARALFADVRAGDLLFVPGHVPHAARNLEKSVGISQNLLTVHDYPAVMEDFAGYLAKSNRKKKTRTAAKNGANGETEPTGVGLDFLTVRDLYRLLSETKFVSDWSRSLPPDVDHDLDHDRDDDIRFWNADDATKESYDRIRAHLSTVLSERNATEYATRLAYLSNYGFLILALQAFGAWECLGPEGKEALLALVPDAAHDSKRNVDDDVTMIEVLEAVFRNHPTGKNRVKCRAVLDGFIDGVVNVRIPRAVTTLGREKGLTKYCC